MGRPKCPRENPGDGGPFLGGPRPCPPPEDGSHFAEPDITVAIGPVVLDPAHQTGHEPPSQVRLLGGHGIEDRHSVGPVRRAERQGAGLEQSGAHQPLSYPGPGLLVRGVRHGAGAVGAQLVGEGVVPLQPGHFLDQVDLTRHIRTPARDLYGEPPVLRRDEEPHRGEQPLDLGALHLHAKQPADALGAKKDRALLLGRGPEVDRRRAHLTSRHGDDQLDGAP